MLSFHVTGIGLFVLASLFGIAPPGVIFAGFTSLVTPLVLAPLDYLWWRWLGHLE